MLEKRDGRTEVQTLRCKVNGSILSSNFQFMLSSDLNQQGTYYRRYPCACKKCRPGILSERFKCKNESKKNWNI